MKRFCFVMLVCVLLILYMQPAYAFRTELFTDSEEGIAGLIDLNDTGDYIVMVQIRLRRLGYFHFKPTGRYQGMTRNAVIQFQTHQKDAAGKAIISDGTIGQETAEILFSSRAVRGPISQSIPIGPKADGSQLETGSMLDWVQVKGMLNTGSAYVLTDFNTGKTFEAIYTGGEHHAEMECRTAADTATYKEVFGDAFNFSKRPMLIAVDGQLIACSLQGIPHGEDAISGNGMEGHACLHFSGSKSHVAGLRDAEHNANIVAASGK